MKIVFDGTSDNYIQYMAIRQRPPSHDNILSLMPGVCYGKSIRVRYISAMDKKLLDESKKYLMSTYNSAPIVLRKGRGMKVWSTDGKEYLDFVGGIAVNCLGHCHPRVVIALQKQAQRLIHVSNLGIIRCSST